jgi:hypothetical protein
MESAESSCCDRHTKGKTMSEQKHFWILLCLLLASIVLLYLLNSAIGQNVIVDR